MELIKFVLWLTTGAVIGWFASRIVTTEHGWSISRLKPVEVASLNKNKSSQVVTDSPGGAR